MSYFLRVTNAPKEDLERKTSLHQSDIKACDMTQEEFKKMHNITNNVIEYDGYWCEVLSGLCGYQIHFDVECLCDSGYVEYLACVELRRARTEGYWTFSGNECFNLYEGVLVGQCEDGVLFVPHRLIDADNIENDVCEEESIKHYRPYCISCNSESVDVNSAGGTWCNSCNSWGTVVCPDEMDLNENGQCMCDICVGMRNHPRNE